MRQELRLLLPIQSEQKAPHFLVGLRQPLLPCRRARVDRLRGRAIAQTARGIGKGDPVRRDLDAAFAAEAVETAQHEDVEDSGERSEESRVGTECVSRCRSKWGLYH